MARLFTSLAAAVAAAALAATMAGVGSVHAGEEANAAAAAALASELGVGDAAVSVVRAEEVTWADACLGAAEPDEACLQVLTAGSVIWLAVGTDGYRYHADATGASLRLAAGPFPASEIDGAPLPDGVVGAETPPEPAGATATVVAGAGLSLLGWFGAPTTSTALLESYGSIDAIWWFDAGAGAWVADARELPEALRTPIAIMRGTGFFVVASAETTLTVALPQFVTVGSQDDGGTVELGVGDTLEVVLDGNPTTGFLWDVLGGLDGALGSLGEPGFVADSGLIGAGGVFILRFSALAAGETTLELGYRRPFETGVDPVETFSLTVVVG